MLNLPAKRRAKKEKAKALMEINLTIMNKTLKMMDFFNFKAMRSGKSIFLTFFVRPSVKVILLLKTKPKCMLLCL